MVLKTAVIMFCEGRAIAVSSNDAYPDSAYMLFHMGAASIMDHVMSGDGAESDD